MALYHPPTQDFLQKSLDAQLGAGITASATFNNVTSVQNKAGVFIVDRIDTSGNVITPATKREVIAFTGTSGSTVTTLTRGLAGTTDQVHEVGAVVEFVPDVVQQQGILDALGNLVTTAGVLDTTKVVDLTTAQTLTNKTLTSPVINTPTGDIVSLTGSQTLTNKTLTSPIVSGTGGTGAGQQGYDTTDKAIFIGDGTTKQSIFTSAWKSYTPTYGGNGSMTYGTVTTNYAKYTVIGRLVIVTIYATGTVGGTPNNRLTATLPLTAVTTVDSGIGGGWTSDGGAGFTGMVLLHSATAVGVQRYDATAYTAGANRVMSITFAYEI